MINVTKPFLPPKEEYDRYLHGIWQRNWVTNHGPLANELELRLKEFLDAPHLLFLNNGTIALQIAIKAAELKGEIITTPFSYVATTSSIVWEGCSPVFVDIDPFTFNIDPAKIESAITPQTKGILATHVFGNPCDIDAIEVIARKHRLKVIYDAAHCFGTIYKGKSVFNYGDISTVSFHATKLFHTGEGGAVFTQDAELLKKMAYLRNFGHETPTSFAMIGINGKSSELHAAMGLSVLPHMPELLNKRKVLSEYYHQVLANLKIRQQKIQAGTVYNYSYYPVLFNSEEILKRSIEELNKYQIFPRRYFYPSLDTLSYTGEQICTVSRDIAGRILCLPLYHDLSFEEIDMIARLLLRVQNN
ncbi:MAG: DegT/DnrJ/EryC1/StrS family aminotransferase [Chitinophagaceae bacterium]|nr:DegT/DnrJ/EryC1/StrS family aminotransferase [Chitinophagaceae bacterium]